VCVALVPPIPLTYFIDWVEAMGWLVPS
jgi:hypothetical protein